MTNETFINRPVKWNAENGVVTGETTGSRGKLLLIVRLASGREIKTAVNAVRFTDLAPLPDTAGRVTFGPHDRDYYGDQARMFARLGREI